MSSHCSSQCASVDIHGDTEVKIHEVTYVWTIKNFSFHEAMEYELKSPKFSAIDDNETKWGLVLNPDCTNDGESYVSFYVYLSNSSVRKEVFAKFTLFVLCGAPQETPYYWNSLEDEYVGIDKYIPGQSIGWERFLEKNEIFENDFLIEDTLTIKCLIKYSTHDDIRNTLCKCQNTRLYPNTPECNLARHFGLLFENHDFADVVLSIKGTEYPAHKNILAARSPVFAAMFRHNAKENEENRVYIEDMDKEVVREMLRYIYTGKCEKLHELATGLLTAADKYDLDHLKMICAEELFKNLSVENAASILALADMHGVEELKNGVIKFIVSKPAEVLNTAGWRSIGSNFQLINEVCLAIAQR